MRYHTWHLASGIWHLACQTYALNLFQFHRSRNQTQFLFSSPRSFRVAKSATLSPRPRHLSSLFKLPDLLKLFRLPKVLFFVPLLLSYTQSSVALTAHTSRVIEGTPPYFTFDGGQIKVTSTDSLLSIKLNGNRLITPSTNTSSPTNPIILPVASGLGHIRTVVPPSVSSVSFSDLVDRYLNWGDADGDGQGRNDVTASGSVSISFTDKDGNTVNRSDRLDICNAPYRVTLSSTGGYLQTQYGVPNRTSFSGATVTYYINPYGGPAVCHVRPNLLMGGTTGIVPDDSLNYAGPASIWNPNKGFLVQSTNPTFYDRNFPTTGADGLYFDLLIGGVDGHGLSWSSATTASGSIRATVNQRALPNQGANEDRWITDKSKRVVRVTLSGPRASSSQIQSANPSPLTVPSLPQTFELEGRDRNGNVVRYGFVLKQWFVNRGDKRGTQANQSTWCSGLGYRIARVRDLTNAVCSGWKVNNSYPCTGAVGAVPSSGNNVYKRHIGAGLFTEWGHVSRYADAGFTPYYHWTSDAAGSYGFDVNTYDGAVYGHSASSGSAAVCTAP
ncbi:hypothetical protein [Gilliamella sp. Pas-s95]|uniref:hypothetical protein n=1 Tax=Gilliamella sp. Pas-s95 TaxID=2687317 RepID=UPI001328CC41|nr:hypothetical protein [Gilliamella sp. Pas-s95]MWN06792.1 hypothetical protein [Gilliamella sp. Pas-s95]